MPNFANFPFPHKSNVMGIDTKWVGILEQDLRVIACDGIPLNFIQNDVDKDTVTQVLDDLTFNIRKCLVPRKLENPETGEVTMTVFGSDIGAMCVNRILGMVIKYPNMRRLILMWDESELVPYNKSPEQLKRRKSGTAKEPFSDREIEQDQIQFHGGALGNESRVSRMLHTTVLKNDLIRYLTEYMRQEKWAERIRDPRRKLHIIISGGRKYTSQCTREQYVSAMSETEDEEDDDDDPIDPSDQEDLQNIVMMGDELHFASGKRTKIKEPRKPVQPHINSIQTKAFDMEFFIETETKSMRIQEHFSSPEEYRIGEADLKIPYYVAKFGKLGDVILVKSADTDSIPILLLNVRNWISHPVRDSGFVPFEVLVDLSVKRDVKPRFFNVMNTWRSIMMKFTPPAPNSSQESDCSSILGSPKRSVAWLHNPIEIICLLMVMTETDYVEGMNYVTPRLVWETFMKHRGWEIFARHGAVLISPDPFPDQDQTRIRVGPERRNIQFNAILIHDFIQYMYSCAVFPTNGDYSVAKMKSIDIIVHKLITKGSQSLLADDIHPENRLYARIRRMTWNMDYWVNGPQGETWIIFKTDTKTNLSIYGWEYKGDLLQQIKPELVKFAVQVHTSSA